MVKLFKIKKRRSNVSSPNGEQKDDVGNRICGPAEDIYTNAQRAPHARDAFTFRDGHPGSPLSELDDTGEKIAEEVE